MFKNNYNAVEFGSRIKVLRKKSKMTQEKLAELLYLSVDSTSRMENGKGMCMPEHVVHICEIFGVSTDYLYFGYENLMIRENDVVNNINRMLANCDDAELVRLEQVVTLFLRQ
jgi:transcriptional regulator with XRE-family HTH domain